MKYRIGIDVGGTNTDAAILDENLNVLHSVKVPTTEDVESGINHVLTTIIKESGVQSADIIHAMLGTTHCTNAIVERKNLNKVGLIRIAKPATTAIPPFIDWPQDVRSEIECGVAVVSGGYEFDGKELASLDKEEVLRFCESVRDKAESIAISGVFSPVNNSQEEQVGQWVREVLGDIPISLSYEIGSIGLLERENAAILNSALMVTCQKVVRGFKHALGNLGIDCNIYFSQNDGTLMSYEHTMRYPIFTIGCGITNSIRGAAFLSQVEEAIILDVGGTTTDIGVLQKGFPRESAVAVNIGGVQTNFRMPDMTSIGLAGGTIIKADGSIGPESVGYRITELAHVFGGDVFTLSDVATKVNGAFAERVSYVENLDKEKCSEIFAKVTKRLEDAIDCMKTQKGDVVVVLTGGGSVICADELGGVSRVIRPEHYKSANAVGAALGQVSGEIERVFHLEHMSREEALSIAIEEATKKAIDSGAKETGIQVLSKEDIPLAYLPGNATLIKVKVIGELL